MKVETYFLRGRVAFWEQPWRHVEEHLVVILQLEVLESEEAATVGLDGGRPEMVRILGVLDIFERNQKHSTLFKVT